jgi:hypothetical protein
MASLLTSDSFYMLECKMKKLFKMILTNILLSGYVTVLDFNNQIF